jgi:hypothetical protein
LYKHFADRSTFLLEIISQIAESYNPAYGQPKNVAPSGDPDKSRLAKWFFTPVLAPLLRKRWPIFVFVAVGIAQLVLVGAGLNGWQCPIKTTVGVICPGCGLSTAMTLLVKGYWAEAIRMHVFAPIFLLVLMFIAGVIALPAAYLKSISAAVAQLERKTGLTAIITLGMVLYWLLRVSNII